MRGIIESLPTATNPDNAFLAELAAMLEKTWNVAGSSHLDSANSIMGALLFRTKRVLQGCPAEFERRPLEECYTGKRPTLDRFFGEVCASKTGFWTSLDNHPRSISSKAFMASWLINMGTPSSSMYIRPPMANFETKDRLAASLRECHFEYIPKESDAFSLRYESVEKMRLHFQASLDHPLHHQAFKVANPILGRYVIQCLGRSIWIVPVYL